MYNVIYDLECFIDLRHLGSVFKNKLKSGESSHIPNAISSI